MDILLDINGNPILDVFGNQIVIGGTGLVGTLSLLEVSDRMYGFVSSPIATVTPTTSISAVSVVVWRQVLIPPSTGVIEEVTLMLGMPGSNGRLIATERSDGSVMVGVVGNSASINIIENSDLCNIFGWIWDANLGYMNSVEGVDSSNMQCKNVNIIRFIVTGEVEILP